MRIATDLLTTLGHEGRLSVYRLLVRRAPDGVRPTEMAAALDLKPTTLSAHLSALERAGLITSERHGKSVFYSVDMPRMGALVDFLVADCARGRADLGAEEAARALRRGPVAGQRPLNVLFLCTGNSARSLFAEALLRDLGGANFHAFSAGTHPAHEAHPMAIDLLRRQGHDVETLHPKSIAGFQGADAPLMDFVFTVCDLAANEACPPWPGQPVTAHWGLPDPVKVSGTSAEKSLAFAQTYQAMRRRIEAFTSLPLARLDRLSLRARLDEISGMDDTAQGEGQQ